MRSLSFRSNRRRLIAVAAVALCAAAAPACGSSSSNGKVTVKLSYLWTGAESKALQSVISDFNASQQKIVVKGVSNPDTQAQLASMTSTNGAYDISDNFGTSTGAWASKGIIEPLDSYIERDHFDLSDFVPAALAQGKYDGKVYQLPIAVNDYALLYNKKLFSEAGIAHPPKTMSELATDIAKLTKTGPDGITQLGLAGTSGAGIDYRTFGMVFGGRWYSSDGKPTPDDPKNVEAANFYVDNVIKKYGVKDIQKFASGFGDYQSPQNPFYQGKLAMVMDGEWQPSFIKEFAPNLQWGAVPIPYPDGHPELANTTQVAPGTFYIPRNSQHKDEAWEFMKFLMSKKEMLKFTQAISNLPARTSLLDDPAYKSTPNYQVFLDLLKSKNAISLPPAEDYAEYTADLGKADDALTRLTKSPDDAYADVAKKAKSYDD